MPSSWRFLVAMFSTICVLASTQSAATEPKQTPQSEWYLPTSTTNLAWKAYYSAAPTYDPQNHSCVRANELVAKALSQGERCVAQLIALMHRLGHCREQNKQEGDEWSRKTVGCPVP
jgi:hypothetical protein